MARVDTRDFKRVEGRTNPIIKQGELGHAHYVRDAEPPEPDTSEIMIRMVLEDVRDEILDWMIDTYGFNNDDLRNFPSLDILIYHKDGWNLHDAILKHYKHYYQTASKEMLIAALNRIIDNESVRLRHTIFDSLNERNGMFQKVTIGGDNDCGGCGDYYGEFSVGINYYELPPYHWECHCWAAYHD